MSTYLKIENPGVVDKSSVTLLGASTKKYSGDSRTIGLFGSGSSLSVATLLRHDIQPIFFADSLKMEFKTRTVEVNGHPFERVVCKYGGKDATGKSRSATEDLGYVLEYGSNDWTSVDLALREFVSNALDAVIEQDRPYTDVVVEVANAGQVRAKAGTTRVFVPLTADVLSFLSNLDKWFLHFKEPHLLSEKILPKAGRNLEGRKSAVIYRRGVRVREFESSDTPSLFDYNLEDLQLDEARKVDDWRVKAEAAKAFRHAKREHLTAFFQSFVEGSLRWEHSFDSYGLEPGYSEYGATVDARKKLWSETFRETCGDNAILSVKNGGEVAARKGYKVIVAPEGITTACKAYGVKTPEVVLSQDDREGRTILEATPDAKAAVDWAWELIQAAGLTNGKEKPSVKSFVKTMDGEVITMGFYREGVVYINKDLGVDASAYGGVAALNDQLLSTSLEECVHHASQSADYSRDLQNFLFDLVVKLAR